MSVLQDVYSDLKSIFGFIIFACLAIPILGYCVLPFWLFFLVLILEFVAIAFLFNKAFSLAGGIMVVLIVIVGVGTANYFSGRSGSSNKTFNIILTMSNGETHHIQNAKFHMREDHFLYSRYVCYPVFYVNNENNHTPILLRQVRSIRSVDKGKCIVEMRDGRIIKGGSGFFRESSLSEGGLVYVEGNEIVNNFSGYYRVNLGHYYIPNPHVSQPDVVRIDFK